MSIFSSTPQDHGGYKKVYKFQLAGKWSKSEKISCHAILKNPYEPKMDVILTSNSGNRDKKIFVFRRASQTRCIGFVKRTMYVLSFIHCQPWNAFRLFLLFCFVFFFSADFDAARSSLNGVCRWIFLGKGNKKKTFREHDVISLSGEVVSRGVATCTHGTHVRTWKSRA